MTEIAKQRLEAVLTGLVTAAMAVLLLLGLRRTGAPAASGSAALLGVLLGLAAGAPVGMAIEKLSLTVSDRLLPRVLALLALPPALWPAHPGWYAALERSGGEFEALLWSAVAAIPLGLCVGASWAIWPWRSLLARKGILGWFAVGFGLGTGLTLATLPVAPAFQGAALVVVFAAPVLWPLVPSTGDRSLLTRMLITLQTIIATMILLFA